MIRIKKLEGRRSVKAAAIALATAAVLALPVGFANADTVVQWPTPNSATPYQSYTLNDDGSIKTQHVRAAIFGYYCALSGYLGVDNPVVVSMKDPITADTIATNGLMGTYASPANQNPDPYWANYWLAVLNPALGITPNNDGTTHPAAGHEVAIIPTENGMASANLKEFEDSGVSASFYYRPEIVTSGQSSYAAYNEIVSKINATGQAKVSGAAEDAENGIGLDNYVEGDESYDPYLFCQKAKAPDGAYLAAGSNQGNISILYLIAQAAQEVMDADPTKTTRYGNPLDIAADVEELSYGSRYYVLKGIENGTIQKKTVAFVNSLNAAEQTVELTVVDPDVYIGSEAASSATNYFHPALDLQGITTNLVDKMGASDNTEWNGILNEVVWNGITTNDVTSPFGYVTVPISYLTEADVLMCTNAGTGGGASVTQADLSAAFDVAGISEADRPVAFYNCPTDLGMGGWNSDRICYMPAFVGFIYPEVAPASEMMAYYYYHVTHVKNEYLDDTVAINCSKLTLRAGDTLAAPAGGYASKFAAIKAKLVEGMQYYAANRAKIESECVNLKAITDGNGNLRNPRFKNGTYASTSTIQSAVDLFSDISAANDDWEINYITSAVAQGFMSGYSNSTAFGPYDSLTREMAITILYRAMTGATADDPYGTDTAGYKDVAPNQWYTSAVAWAKETGVATGFSPDTFGVGQSISRQDLAVMVHRAAGKPGAGNTSVYDATKDNASVTDYATDALKWTAYTGILSGVQTAQGAYLQPLNPVLRVQMAKIISESFAHLN